MIINQQRVNAVVPGRVPVTSKLGRIRDLQAAYAAIGHPRADQLAAALARLESINADRAALDAVSNRARMEVVVGVASGALTVGEGALQLAAAGHARDAADLVHQLAADARVQAEYLTLRALVDEGDRLVIELDQIVRAEAAVIASAAPKVTSIRTDSDAVRAGGAIADTWHQVHIAAARIEGCWALAGHLRFVGIVPSLRDDRAGAAWRWERPEQLTPKAPGDTPTRRLMADIVAGAGPTCRTANEVLHVLHNPAQRPQDAPQRPQRPLPPAA